MFPNIPTIIQTLIHSVMLRSNHRRFVLPRPSTFIRSLTFLSYVYSLTFHTIPTYIHTFQSFKHLYVYIYGTDYGVRSNFNHINGHTFSYVTFQPSQVRSTCAKYVYTFPYVPIIRIFPNVPYVTYVHSYVPTISGSYYLRQVHSYVPLRFYHMYIS
jgi:hypothetical protein